MHGGDNKMASEHMYKTGIPDKVANQYANNGVDNHFGSRDEIALK